MKYYNVQVDYFNSPRVGATKTTATPLLGLSSKIIMVCETDLVWGSIYANKEQKGLIHPDERLSFDTNIVKYLFDLNNPSPDLQISPDILNVEQTQKSFFMNRIGVILCNIIAKNYFGVKHLNHLQSIIANSKVHFIPSKPSKFPDYYAQNGSNHFIFEAKGTNLRKCSKQEEAAIEQLNAINHIYIKKKSINLRKYLIQTTVDNLKVKAALVDPTGEGVDIIFDGDLNYDYSLELSNNIGKIISIDEKEYSVVMIGNYAIGFCSNNQNIEKDILISNILNNRDRNTIRGLGDDSIIEGKLYNDGTLILKVMNKKD